jgi:nanoRNase/pAp phosphatase (c-di-AMP/oligoRNAs hydrolase)
MDDFSQTKNIIDGAKNIVIVVDENADQDAFGAALGLFFALKDKKNIFVPRDKNPKEVVGFLNEGSERKKFVISFKNEVSEIFYEKKNEGVDLYLTPKNIEDASPENFFCKIVSDSGKNYLSSPSFFDLVIAFNVDSFKKLEESFEDNIDSIYQCAVINIGNRPKNENYGEANLIEEGVSLSEKTALLLETVQGDVSEKAAGFLLWGITSSLDSLKTDQTLAIIKKLVQKGGNFYFSHTESGVKRKLALLEKTVKNLNFLEKENLYISLLSEDDLRSVGSTSSDLGFVVEKMKNLFFLPSFVLLWEGKSSPLTVKGVFYSDREEVVQKIKNAYRGDYKNQGGIFLTRKEDLTSAKKEIITLLI